MKENRRNSIKTKAYEDLRYRIITQELPPGELLREKELMERYGIGRTPLREVIQELQRQGLVRKVPRSGTWVAPLDLNFVKQIAEVRQPLEKLAGELATERISENQLRELTDILQKAEANLPDEDTDLQLLIQYESRFHHIIYAATGNQKLEELLLEFQSISSRLWHNLFFTREHLREMLADHQAILEKLKAGDGKGCGELLQQHTQAYFGRKVHSLQR